MDGEIQVKSTVGRGTEFTMLLPIQQNAPMIVDLGKKAVKDEVSVFTHPRDTDKVEIQLNTSSDEEKPTALVIEDNKDVVRYLLACLEGDFQLEVAYNGQEGIDKALEIVPDIIVSDVMMPEKDGLQVCDALKNDIRTSHIPIILLTAKADIQSKIAGLKRGADAYLPKPFHQEELLIQMYNLIHQRKKLQQRYQAELTVSTPEESGGDLEDSFLKEIRSLVEENIAKADFDISWLASQVHMSRSQLFRKIKALTGISPSIFVRKIRLQKARTLLLTTQLNISEITYDVGFSSPAFFTRIFREEFGQSPTEMREGSTG